MSSRVSHRIRRPVERGDATRSLLLMLISFAGSVVGTRLVLELTGYPQVGNSELHIAHVLWGGLLLFAASLLLLRQDRLGVRLGVLVLLAALTVVNLLAFYFNQFATVVWALTQFTVLLALLRYRHRFFIVPRAGKTI